MPAGGSRRNSSSPSFCIFRPPLALVALVVARAPTLGTESFKAISRASPLLVLKRIFQLGVFAGMLTRK